MSKPSFPEIAASIDVELLRDNYDLRKKDLVRHTFDPEQLLEMKEEYFRLSSQLAARQELAAHLKAAAEQSPEPREAIEEIMSDRVDAIDYGQATRKELLASTAALLKKINSGHEVVEEQLFGIAHHEVGFMAYYDVHGLFVYDRPLKVTERQTSIRTIKTA
ncbi:hypothetical protein [Lewinella sp. JB7]|uniref:hypothetical protein n=1 Tax=Lewinella sp. JB7 TaxID=2962887 RepID=UPI0020C979E1|nr:hypothetical protein [Lewinella sp. JB7]MCP9237177.1 hypothetical protein [Lewinella sp. JB7]